MDGESVAETEDTPNNDESRFGIFHKNRFFELTPLSGWAFVYAAKTAKEIVFWYVIILTFIGLTIYNVHNVVTNYASGPTSTNVLLQTSTSDLSLPNMTIKLKIPIKEMMNQLALDMTMKFHQQDSVIYYDEILNKYLCKEHDMFGNDFRKEQKAHDLRLHSSPETLKSLVNIKADSVRTTLSNITRFEEWKVKISQGKDALKKEWQNLLIVKSRTQMQMNAMANKLNRIINRIGKANDTLEKLLLLEGLKSTRTRNDVKKVLENVQISVAQLYSNAVANIAHSVHFNMDSNATVTFLDDKFVDDFYMTNILTMSLIPEPRTRDLNFKIYLSNYMWIMEVINALNEALDEHENGWARYLKCDDGTYFYQMLDDITYILLQQHYIKKTDLEIEINYEKSIVIKRRSGFEHMVIINPLVMFNSQIDNCFNDTLKTCMDNCVSEEYTSQHNCLPWNVAQAHVDANTKLCDDHYEEQYGKLCITECSQRLIHSCTLILRQIIHKTVSGVFPPQGDLALFSVNITMPKNHNFAQFVEGYAISRESFLFLLGGALEFWSGINILGIIHLLVFTIIQSASKYFGMCAGTNNDESAINIVQTEKELHKMVASVHVPDNKGTKLWSSIRSWLRGNQLYEETPISGYAYIAAAKTLYEVVFWYIVVALFILFASVNGYNTLMNYYALKPTRTQLLPVARIEAFSIPNMTLKLHLPLLLLTHFKIKYNENKHLGFDCNTNMFSTRFDVSKEPSKDEMWDYYIYGSPTNLSSLQESLFNEWNIALNTTRLQLTHFTENSHSTLTLNNRNITQQWQKGFADNAIAVNSTVNDLKNLTWGEIQQQIISRMTQYQHYHSTDNNLGIKLIVLQGIKYGKSPYQLLHDAMYGSLGLFENQSDSYNTDNILQEQGWTIFDLYSETLTALSKQICININNEAANVSLKDFSLQMSQPVERQVEMELQISLPTGIKELEIEVRVFLHEWLTKAVHGGWLDSLARKPNYNDDRSVLFYILVKNVFEEAYEAWNSFTMSFLTIDSTTEALHDIELFCGVSSEITMVPTWHMTSKTDECDNEDLQWCITQCQLEQYRRQCGCYPWHVMMAHAKSLDSHGIAMCAEACSPEISACEQQCTPCERQWLQMTSLKQSGKVNDTHLHRVHIKIAENLYPQLIEQYEMSSSSFISNLGAILDFWMGINVLAFMHLSVYIIKQCSSAHKIFQKNHGENEPNSIAAKLQKQRTNIDNLRSTIGDKLSILRTAAIDGKLVAKQHTAFNWLRHNKFFQQTNMTGFSFISASMHYVEMIFWWLLIIIFSFITGVNVYNAFMEYNMKPTHTTVSFSRNKTEIEIGNLTLTLQIPLTEFSTNNPIYLPMYHDNTELDETSESIGHYLVCVVSKPGNILPIVLNEMFVSWLHLLNDSWTWTFQNLMTEHEPTTLEQWSEGFDKASVDLLNFLHNGAQQTEVPRNTKIAKHLENEFNTLLNKPLERFSKGHTRLMLLEALKHGQHPRESLYKKLKYDYIFFDDRERIEKADDNDTTMASDLLLKLGMDAKDLYEQVQLDLSHMVQMSYGNSSGVEAILQDWNYDTRNQELKYAIAVPNVDELNIEIRFYSHMWHQHILKTFHNYFASIDRLDKPLCNGMDIGEMMDMHKGRMQDWLFGTNWMYNIRLDTHHGESIHGEVGYHQHYVVKPNSHFHSHTQSCFHGSRERCIDKCLAERHLSFCQCVPWNFMYLQIYDSSPLPLCTESCNSVHKNQCEDECQRILLHPCEMTLYEINSDALEKTETVYSLTIKKAEAMYYITYTESYGFTLGSFMAHLGGLFELWMGINLLSIIHLLTYFVKQIIKSKKHCSSTNKSIYPENDVESQLLAIKIIEQRLMEELNEKENQIQMQALALKHESNRKQ